MPRHLIPEDYSIDMRTILAKERTILAYQSVQLSKIGISLAVFATGLGILKFFSADFQSEILPGIIIMTISGFIGIRAYIRYAQLNEDLTKMIELEEKIAHEYRKKMLGESERKNKKH